jgi:hypothetical protein
MDQNEKSRIESQKSRWTTDPGAIPGEPYDYLDIPVGTAGEIGEAKAVIVEIEMPRGSRWEARAFGGKSLYRTAQQEERKQPDIIHLPVAEPPPKQPSKPEAKCNLNGKIRCLSQDKVHGTHGGFRAQLGPDIMERNS